MERITEAGATIVSIAGLVLLVLVAVSWLSGCATSRAQVATQTAIVAVAEGINSADRIVAPLARSAAESAVDEIVEHCVRNPCPDSVRLLRERLAPWYRAVESLEAARMALEGLEDVAEVWYSTGSLSRSWGAICVVVVDALDVVLSRLESVGVRIVPLLRIAPEMIRPVCAMEALR